MGDKDKISELPGSRDTDLETMRGKLVVRDLSVQEMLRLVEAIEADPFPVQIDLLEVTTRRVLDKDQPKVDDEYPKLVVNGTSLELTAFALKDVDREQPHEEIPETFCTVADLGPLRILGSHLHSFSQTRKCRWLALPCGNFQRRRMGIGRRRCGPLLDKRS